MLRCHVPKIRGAALGAILAFGLALPASAIQVTGTDDADDLTAALGLQNMGLIVSDARLGSPLTQGAAAVGMPSGTFTNASGTYGIEDGIVLSTGDVAHYADGPSPGQESTNYRQRAPAFRERLARRIVFDDQFFYDATLLEIDFVLSPGIQALGFSVVFGSEEWSLGEHLADGFGIFLDGSRVSSDVGSIRSDHPDLTPIPGTELDAVLAPGGDPVVHIDIEAEAYDLDDGETHTLAFLIFDTGDGHYDSTVFVSGTPLGGPITPEPTTGALLGVALAALGAWRRRSRL